MNKTTTELKNLTKVKSINGKIKFVYDKSTPEIKVFAILKVQNKYYIGEAKRSLKDVFSKKIGRAIALGRVIKNYENKIYINVEHIENYYRFVGDRDHELIPLV